jgi:ribosome-binding protein aMBF1 (putative translation factor)
MEQCECCGETTKPVAVNEYGVTLCAECASAYNTIIDRVEDEFLAILEEYNEEPHYRAEGW